MRWVVERNQNLVVGKFSALEPCDEVNHDPIAFCLVDFLPTGLSCQQIGYFPKLELLSMLNRFKGFCAPCGLYMLR